MMKNFQNHHLRNLCFALAWFLLAPVMIFAVESSPPSAVSNLQAEAGNGQVVLSWDPAQDSDGLVTGYKVYYDTQSTETYTSSFVQDSTDTTYTVLDLDNGVDYYFSVTAMDDEGNESEEYSDEVTARPMLPAEGGPSVVSAEQISQEHISVKMSEAVIIKSIRKSFFIQAEGSDYEGIEILGAEIEGDRVILQTPKNVLIAGINYVVTATSAVEDLEGNPVNSGSTDTAILTAVESLILPETYAPDSETAPPVELEPQPSQTEDPAILFGNDPGDLDFSEVENPIVENTTSNENFNNFEPIEMTHSSAHFESPASSPSDVSSIRVDSSKLEAGRKITIRWQASPSEAVLDQIFYTRERGKEWDQGVSVGSDTLSHVVSVKKDKTYEIKIVVIDRSGKSSKGLSYVFDTTLPRSGANHVIFIFFSLLLGFMFFSRKKI